MAKRFMILMIVLWVALILGLFASLAFAHDDAIIKCTHNIIVTKAIKLNEQIDSSNGLLSEYYDTNAFGELDEKADIIVQSHITDTTNEEGLVPHRANPVFWYVDIDNDEVEDLVYEDPPGLGKCEDIVLYYDRRDPERSGGEREPYNSGGKVGI